MIKERLSSCIRETLEKDLIHPCSPATYNPFTSDPMTMKLSILQDLICSQVSQLQQAKLFGHLPGQAACSSFQLKSLLKEARISR